MTIGAIGGFPNKYASKCVNCGADIAIGGGICTKDNGRWVTRCARPCEAVVMLAPAAPKTNVVVGDLAGILVLFERARQHLKFPAIVLSVNETLSIRINVAGERAKIPGSLTVVDAERNEQDGERDWFGRILLDGTFQPSKAAARYMPALAQRLAQFAADPSKIAGDDGRLHGRCCFCRLPLSDERSTAVGYGKKCASNFGLAWGNRPGEFAAAAA